MKKANFDQTTHKKTLPQYLRDNNVITSVSLKAVIDFAWSQVPHAAAAVVAAIGWVAESSLPVLSIENKSPSTSNAQQLVFSAPRLG